jgi:hypothetical protein
MRTKEAEMSAYTICCSSPGCRRLAFLRCQGCGQALCERHARRLPAFGRTSQVCAACQRRHYTDPKRRFTRLPFSQT